MSENRSIKSLHTVVLGWKGFSAGGLSALLALLYAPDAFAETVLTEGALGPQTWTQAGNPYLVSGNLTIESLRIEAGTVVHVGNFDPYSTGRVAISVTGDLAVEGSASEPVTIEGLAADGKQAYFDIYAASPNLTGLIFRRGWIYARKSVLVNSSRFEYSVLYANGPVEVDRTLFLDSSDGIIQGTSGTPVAVKNSVFARLGSGVRANGEVSVVNCTFEDMAWTALQMRAGAARNTIFTNAERLFSSGELNVSHSLIWNIRNESPPLNSTLNEGDGVLRADPRYVSSTDFRLLAGSPAIDSGTADGAPPLDVLGASRPKGTGIDMGAYEFDPTTIGMGGAGGMAGVSGTGGAAGTSGIGGMAGNASSGEGNAPGGGAGGTAGSTGPDNAGGGDDEGGVGGTTGGSMAEGGSSGVSTGGSEVSTGGRGATASAQHGMRNSTEGCGCRVGAGTGRGASFVAVLLALVLAGWRRMFASS